MTATLAGCAIDPSAPTAAPTRTVIAFGSCAHQDRPQPIWDAIVAIHADAFLLIGDAIYADTTDPRVMAADYARLGRVPGFQQLRETTRLLALWDDHDYGENDAGASYAMKAESKQLFLDFFEPLSQESPPTPRRSHPGIYHAAMIGSEGRRVHVILLDGRWFRSDPGEPDATMLGEEQWRWFEAALEQPAELRLVVSGIQVLTDDPSRESWLRFPAERERLLDLVTSHGPALILSGDRHFAEISRISWKGRTLFDFTASGLNVALLSADGENRNSQRVEPPFYGDNFGTVTVHWEAALTVDLAVHDVTGTIQRSRTLTPAELGR